MGNSLVALVIALLLAVGYTDAQPDYITEIGDDVMPFGDIVMNETEILALIEKFFNGEISITEFGHRINEMDEATYLLHLEIMERPMTPEQKEAQRQRMERHFRINLEHLVFGTSTATADVDLRTVERFVFYIGTFQGGEGIAICRLNGKIYYERDRGSFSQGIVFLNEVRNYADLIEEDLTRLIQAMEQSNMFDWPEYMQGEFDEAFELKDSSIHWRMGIQFSDGSKLVRGGSGHRGWAPDGIGAIASMLSLGPEIQERQRLEREADTNNQTENAQEDNHFPPPPPAETVMTVDLNHPDFIAVNNRTLVPAAFFETLGFAIDWEPISQTMTLTKQDHVVAVSGDVPILMVNNSEILLDVPPQIIEGKEMFPLRAILESVGYHVEWERETNTMVVSAVVVD